MPARLQLRVRPIHINICSARHIPLKQVTTNPKRITLRNTQARRGSLFFSTTTMTEGKKHERAQSTDNVLRHPSPKRAKEIDTSDNPYDELVERMDAAQEQEDNAKPNNVLHWFRSKDLRAHDNRALFAASQKAREGGKDSNLITCFLYSPKDLEWHGTSPARCDFMLESLRLLQEELSDKNIPLVILTAEKRSEKGGKILEFVRENNVSHVFANVEYEVDELRRDIKLFEDLAEKNKEDAVKFVLHHDQTIIKPRTLVTGSGGPMKVFTPYHKAWLSEVADDPSLFDLVGFPESNEQDKESSSSPLGALFSKENKQLPKPPESKDFSSKQERDRLRKLWPAGHKAGMDRLRHFLTKKAPTYAENRSTPSTDNSSRLSPYFASGVISVREALTEAAKSNGDGDGGKQDAAAADFSGTSGIASWVREVVFREFYRHMMAVTPHNSMNLPQNLKFDFVEWEEDEEGWYKWCEGRTGVPFVDAGMRQLREEGYMHNRLRMNVSSYLRTNLLIDYRKGERFFAEHLVDWDLCNNTQGWEPSYTVFNPVSQAEKCDPKGEYIRRWVPELKGVEGKAVFDPWNRLGKEEFAKLGYPEPHVDFKESKERCIQRYKRDLAEADI